MANLYRKALPALLAFMLLTVCNNALATGGDIDLTFASNGIAIEAVDLVPSGGDSAVDTLIAGDGSIYQVGYGGVTGYGNKKPVVLKFTAQGTLDASFGTQGRLVLPNTTEGNSSYGALLSNGNLLIATTELDQNLQPMAVLRQYRPDGSIDSAAFGGAGVTSLSTLPSGQIAYINDVAVDSKGNIIVAGNSLSGSGGGLQLLVARLLPNGNLDPSFAGGVRQSSPNPQFHTHLAAIRILDNDDIVVGGSTYTSFGDTDFVLWKIGKNGSDDSSFGNAGFKVIWFDINGIHDDHLADLELRNDGSIMAVGQADPGNGTSRIVATLLSASGQIITSFGNQNPSNGRFSLGFTAGDQINQATRVVGRSDGSMVIALAVSSDSGRDFAALQFNPQGYLDTNFGLFGFRHYPYNYGTGYELPTSMAIDSQGRVLLGGLAGYGGTDYDFMLLRINP
ncbi:MAG: hypothetical protein DHS20C11_14430 [Lysobacteraceae bacterium]|nr:MAG: hypothetical protein DHS20C11_14430 [Xanthomonadaceae bacterium]